MKPRTVVFTLLLATAFALRGADEPPPTRLPGELYGVYELDAGERVFVAAEEGRPFLGLPGGEVRGLFAGAAGEYRYGPTLGAMEPVAGRISFAVGGDGGPPRLSWVPTGGSERRAAQVPIRRQEVRFDNRGLTLAGTLYLPPGPPPHPAIVLTHGSGPETRGPGFYELFFSSLGLAVLSYDKRGAGESGGASWRAPFAEYARDALAGVDLLAARPDIDPARIGLHGPSQGGWIAPLAASMSSSVAFVIIRSGNAITPRRQDNYLVARRLHHLTDLDDGEIAAAVDYLDLRMDRLLGRRSRAEFQTALRAKRRSAWGSYISDRLPNAEFWRPNAEYDPEPALRGLRCPLLVLLGESDNSTPAAENSALFERILGDSGHPDYSVVVFPRANHGLFETMTGRPLEEELPELTRLVPGYLDTMTEWLRTQVLEGQPG